MGKQDPLTYRHPRTLEQAFGPDARRLNTGRRAWRECFDAEDRAVLLVCALGALCLGLAQLIGLPV